MWADFEPTLLDVGETSIFVTRWGSGPPVLLLHGFPETHLMWRTVGPLLAHDFTVVCADLRGYGHSGCPPSTDDHAPYSKRTMAADLVAAMGQLGFDRFMVVGHDRGGRVAYRMALDHPTQVARMAALDIVPTSATWDRADARFALTYWPWSLLAQPEPLPEHVLATSAEAVVANALDAWGSSAATFSPAVRAAYADALREPKHAHAICEEYRAAATIDRAHDEADQAAHRQIECPVLALWSESGPLGEWYHREGGPASLWSSWCRHLEGRSIGGGHFFPEEMPALTAEELRRFLTA